MPATTLSPEHGVSDASPQTAGLVELANAPGMDRSRSFVPAQPRDGSRKGSRTSQVRVAYINYVVGGCAA